MPLIQLQFNVSLESGKHYRKNRKSSDVYSFFFFKQFAITLNTAIIQQKTRKMNRQGILMKKRKGNRN